MGYTKIVQYGNVTEIYEYEKNRSDNRRKHVSALTKKRQKQARLYARAKGTYERSKRSIRRSQQNFFRLCHHNNINSKTIHFVTLTFAYDLSFKTAGRHVAEFLQKIKRYRPEISLRFISVPEVTKKGRFHFHLLVYDLPPETSSVERKTRNFQRLFRRGYVDIMLATYTSTGIAGYMAKYMAKALTELKNETTRGYTCSRNIERFYSTANNALGGYTDLILPSPEEITDVQTGEYEVPYLGRCHYRKITK